MQNDANNDGVQDSDVCLIDTELGKQYSDWSFPNLTLRFGRSTFQSMILMYDDRATSMTTTAQATRTTTRTIKSCSGTAGAACPPSTQKSPSTIRIT